MSDTVTKWDFDRDLRRMVRSCVGLSVSTAGKKSAAFYKKYEGLLHYSECERDRTTSEMSRLRKIVEALRTGRINYYQNNSNAKCVLLTKDIQQVDIKSDGKVMVTMSGGREILLGDSFQYLVDLF